MTKKVLKYSIILVLAILFVFQFIIGWHRVGDKTMENTIYENELVWVNKLPVGAWFLGMKMPAFGSLDYLDVICFAHPEINDAPMYEKPRLLSRIVGKPGDRVQIIRKELFVNDSALLSPDSATYGYRIIFKEGVDAEGFFTENKISQHKTLIDSMGIFEVPLTNKMASRLQNDERVDYVRMLKTIKGGANRIFPKNPYRSWSEDDFGPLKVPKKGDIVTLTYRNIDIYKNIIVNFEGNTLRKHVDQIYINDKRSNSYTIKENYYFVIDDNRDWFFDSREWGFVPEKYIIGKVMGIE